MVCWDGRFHAPFVMRLLRELAEDEAVAVRYSSLVSGTGGVTEPSDLPAENALASSAILHRRAAPYLGWAAHLASFGGQAAVVAGSPYYKLLVGKILGMQQILLHDTHMQYKATS